MGSISAAVGRAETTRQRHGDDFYARIGRKSWEMRQRARLGDPAALALLERRRLARANRRPLWREVLEAREAVTLLREELATRAHANAEPSRAARRGWFAYSDEVRAELRRAEERLAALEARHRELLQDLQVGALGEG